MTCLGFLVGVEFSLSAVLERFVEVAKEETIFGVDGCTCFSKTTSGVCETTSSFSSVFNAFPKRPYSSLGLDQEKEPDEKATLDVVLASSLGVVLAAISAETESK